MSDHGLVAPSRELRRVLLRLRDAVAIHRTIQVTKPTATIDSVPPMISWASNVSPFGP